MLTRVDLRGWTGDPMERIPRADVDREAARANAREVVASVRARGDEAVLEYQATFGPTPAALRVPADEIERAAASVDPAVREAIAVARARIGAYHERQLTEERAPFWRISEGGATVGEETRPLGRVGCLAPGGVAPLPSSVLMTAVPARVAGVAEIAVCSPPQADGHVHPVTLAACAEAGVQEVYAVGGAQAVAALAYGTETIARVDRIVGPGGIWTTMAKHEVSVDVGIDSLAGPTEVAIIADDTAPPAFVAADLVAQAEHDPLATALLITPSESLIEAVEEALEKELAAAPRREEVERALLDFGRAIVVEDIRRAVDVSNAFAPEHLEIMTDDAPGVARSITNAGAVFIGAGTPVALGDYIAGTNHVLPTAGHARFAGPLRASDFIRSTAIVQFEPQALDELGPALIALADAEGLDAHARAVRARLDAREGS